MRSIVSTITLGLFFLLPKMTMSQDYYDPDTEEEYERNANRLINLDFTQLEIITGVSALILFLVAYWSYRKKYRFTWILLALGGIVLIPVLMLVLGLVITSVKYLFYAGIVIGGAYFLYKHLQKEKHKK